MSIRVRDFENNSTNVRDFSYGRLAIRTLLNLIWYVSPATAVGLVRKHVFRPARYESSAEEKKILESGRLFQLDINGKTIRAWKWGKGPSILFIHGWNGRGVQFHHFFEPFIAAGHSVLAFDAPAHGESSGNTSSYFEWTDCARAFLNRQSGFDIVGVVGHSLGGSAVINALAKESLAIPSVLIAPALRLRRILFDTFDAYGIPDVVYRKAIEEFEQRFGYSLEDDDPWKLLPAIETELMIVHDQSDLTIPFHDSMEMARKWSTVRLTETEGLGHRRILADRTVVESITNYMVYRIEAIDFRPMQYRKSIVEDMGVHVP